MEIASALILAGRDKGDRPWPIAPAGPKHLVPVANRPILFHNLEALRAAGVLEATILFDAQAEAPIRRAVGDGRDWGIVVRYAEWDAARGVRGALSAGHSYLRDEPVLVQQGDALLREHMHGHIAAFAREQLDALALRLRHPAGASLRALAPGYLLSPRAVEILLDGVAPAGSPMADVRARGGRVRVENVDGCLPCHGTQDMLLESNRRVLERLEPSVDPASMEDCTVQGPVEVHPTARIRRSLLRGPLVIGAGARITDAYVGPYTSLGAGVTVEGAEIEHSIVLPEAELRFVGTRLESSVIGRGARIGRKFDLPGAIRLSIGDGAEVVLR